jgi:hypothetical protein
VREVSEGSRREEREAVEEGPCSWRETLVRESAF